MKSNLFGEKKNEIGEKLFLIFWLKSLTGKKNNIKYKIYLKTISGVSNCQKQNYIVKMKIAGNLKNIIS